MNLKQAWCHRYGGMQLQCSTKFGAGTCALLSIQAQNPLFLKKQANKKSIKKMLYILFILLQKA
jgi:hypothetical protein